MKILIPLYNYNIGGAQKTMIKYANILAEFSDYEVFLYAFRHDGQLMGLINPSVNVISTSNGSGNRYRELFRVLKKTKCDRIISTFPVISIFLLFLKSLGLIKAKVLIREATTPSMVRKLKMRDRIVDLLVILLYRRADVIIAPSIGIKNDLMKNFYLKGRRIKVLYNPVINHDPAELPVEIKPRMGEQIHICYFGRISPVKRLEIQIEALSLLKTEYKDRLSLVFFGPVVDEQYYVQLQQLIRRNALDGHVSFREPVTKVEDVIREFDILLLTSEYEGLPSVLLEALAAGLHVISCDCKSGPAEILDNGRFGDLVRYEQCTPQEIARLIKKQIHLPLALPGEDLKRHLEKFSFNDFRKSLTEILN